MTTTHISLNDVDLESIGALVNKIRNEPDEAATTWSASVRWTGGFRSEASVRDFAATQSDEPIGLGGTNTAANPVEQLLGALGNCLVVGYAASATAAGIDLADLRVELEGDLNLSTFLGLEDGHAGFSGISATVHIDSDATDQQLAELHTKVTSTSPVGHTLAKPVQVDIALA